MGLLFTDRSAVSDEIRKLAGRVKDDALRGVLYAMTGDTRSYLALARRLNDENMLEVASAAVAGDKAKLLWLILKMVDHGRWSVLAELTLLLKDRDLQRWAARIILNQGNDAFFHCFPGILSGEVEDICITYVDFLRITPTPDTDARSLLARLEAYYSEKDPDDEEAQPIVTEKDRVLLITAALALAPE